MKKYLLLLWCFIALANFSPFAQKANFEQANKFTQNNVKKYLGSSRVNPNWI
ncbi:hypothetical protein [Carboxylicivirga marina]|nr:hypothetical protein [uncultured Carboxylicivirga sp.]